LPWKSELSLRAEYKSFRRNSECLLARFKIILQWTGQAKDLENSFVCKWFYETISDEVPQEKRTYSFTKRLFASLRGYIHQY